MIFPHPLFAVEDGIVAVGGDLHTSRLVTAYKFGIFPWYSEGQPILWWFPKDRYAIPLKDMKVPKSMRTYFNNHKYRATLNADFATVIDRCQNQYRPGQPGTWITPEMKDAYIELHAMGSAHSVEVWEGEDLVGGLYGVSSGRIFSGESMFSDRPNASKFGAIALFRYLYSLGFVWVDCQQYSRHMELLGGQDITGSEYFEVVRSNFREKDLVLGSGINII